MSSGEEVSMMTLGGDLLLENFRLDDEDKDDFVFLDDKDVDEFWQEYQCLGFFWQVLGVCPGASRWQCLHSNHLHCFWI